MLVIVNWSYQYLVKVVSARGKQNVELVGGYEQLDTLMEQFCQTKLQV